MTAVLINIQDQIKAKDTAEIVTAYEIVPAKKIESSEGAIIPKEAIEWTALQPSIPIEQKDSNPFTYILIGVIIIISVFILVRVFFNKRRKRSI